MWGYYFYWYITNFLASHSGETLPILLAILGIRRKKWAIACSKQNATKFVTLCLEYVSYLIRHERFFICSEENEHWRVIIPALYNALYISWTQKGSFSRSGTQRDSRDIHLTFGIKSIGIPDLCHFQEGSMQNSQILQLCTIFSNHLNFQYIRNPPQPNPNHANVSFPANPIPILVQSTYFHQHHIQFDRPRHPKVHCG